MTVTVTQLPPYPSAQARRQLPASQLASLNAIIASTLAQVTALPPEKCNTKSSQSFIQSYARDASFQSLHSLIWETQDSGKPRLSKDEELIRKYTLKLAEKVVSSLDLQVLLDLAIGYSSFQGYKQRLRSVLTAASEAGYPVQDAVEKDLVPALTLMLSPQAQTQGLYALRKAAHCILSFLRVSPPPFTRHFSHNKLFILALAQTYDTSLTSIATSYGGLNVLRSAIDRAPGAEVDDWERIWVDTKVALIDSFHILFSQLLEDLSSAKGQELGLAAERTFDIVFGLLELPTPESSSTTSVTPTPFLNRPLLADYQQSYSLSRTLASVLKHAEEKDPRLDILESALASIDSSSGPDGKEPGALRIVLRSYGMQPGIDNLGAQSKHHQQPLPETTNTPPPLVSDSTRNKGKGKDKARVVVEDPELDSKITQILDILPDSNPEYLRLLLKTHTYRGDPEQVLGALLEGRAPTEEELAEKVENHEKYNQEGSGVRGYDVSERRNVFDDQEFDVAQVTLGKRNIGANFLKDRSFVDQMKADILRRAEAIFEEEEEEEDTRRGIANNEREPFGAEDDLEETGGLKIRVTGDGEETDESDAEEDDEERGEERTTPETIAELAWMRDPKLFDRSAATRRSKEREQLRKDTGWADEQIEGWKVMLDRNPKLQEKVKEKHEFRGNQNPIVPIAGPSRGGSDRGRGRGRGRGGARGRGDGGGGGGRGGSNQGPGGDTNTRDRAFKDKHKASRANHNRKRGHDKKMARAGAGVPPS